MKADLLPMDAPEMSEMLTGSLGEWSPFHHTFGYFGDGVSLNTATLPPGWHDRLIAIDNPNTNGYVGLCLEVYDLLFSKYFAGRDKDHEFCSAVVKAGLADRETLQQRLAAMEIETSDRARIERKTAADFGQ